MTEELCGSADAEILLFVEREGEDGKAEQKLFARLPFIFTDSWGFDREQIMRLFDAADLIAKLYESFPDSYVSVRVVFNHEYVNV